MCTLYLADVGFGRTVDVLLGKCLAMMWLVLNLSVSGSISYNLPALLKLNLSIITKQINI